MKDDGHSNVGINGGLKSWERLCDTCRSAPSTVYCRADSAFLCTGCDARTHAANRLASGHERVLVCEACERAPAAFLCKADAASLCSECDADIHSANPLARRHHRVPISPIPGCLYCPPANDRGGPIVGQGKNLTFLTQEEDDTLDEDEQEEAASWLLFNPVKNNNLQKNNKGFLFGADSEVVDEYLDLVDYNSCQENQFTDQQQQQQYYGVSSGGQKSCGGDGVVPVQCGESKCQIQQQQSFQLEIAYGYPHSINHSISNISSMDAGVGVVPDATVNEVSIAHTIRLSKGTIDLFSASVHSHQQQVPTQLAPMDREARVLRYREKKKNRRFEKTIRYASRKAYAETRPRIKGRFVKRKDADVEVDQLFSTAALMAETGGYGIVPSF